MARKSNPTPPKELLHPEVLKKILASIENLYVNHEDRFMEALQESDKKTIVLIFRSSVDLSETPVEETILSFKDKAIESGMEVNKTFKARVRHELENPKQPTLLKSEAEGE